jgi:hypothetical protein
MAALPLYHDMSHFDVTSEGNIEIVHEHVT